MRLDRALCLAAFVVASAGCGSVAYRDVSEGARAALLPSAPHIAELLLAAGEGKDIDEMDASDLLTPDDGDTRPTKPPKPAPPSAGSTKARKIAVRAGALLVSSAEDVDREPGIMAGLTYDMIGGKGMMSVELGADFGSVSDADGDVTSQVTVISGTGRFSFGSIFALAGASIIVDSFEDVPNDESGTSYIPVFEAGLGTRLASGMVDLRASYMALIGSENVPGLMTIKAGVAF